MKKISSLFLLLIIVAIVISAGIYYKNNQQEINEKSKAQNNTETTEAQTAEIDLKVVELTGVEGKNVLEILKEKHKVEYTDSANGAFISSINELKNSDSEFWQFSVNDIDSTIAADKYITKQDDKIKWQ